MIAWSDEKDKICTSSFTCGNNTALPEDFLKAGVTIFAL
jgi:hypothetical protein